PTCHFSAPGADLRHVGDVGFRKPGRQAHTGRMSPHRALARIARGRLGLFTLDDALAAGFSHDQLLRGARDGRWQRVGRSVYSMPGHEDSCERAVLAGVLSVGPEAVVSHTSAARLLGVDGAEEDAVELTV